jgi:hypothetical protein
MDGPAVSTFVMWNGTTAQLRDVADQLRDSHSVYLREAADELDRLYDLLKNQPLYHDPLDDLRGVLKEDAIKALKAAHLLRS